MLGNDVVGAAGTAAGSGSYGTNALAFLPGDADLAHRLQAFGDGFIARGLGANRPQGQYGSLGCQDFLDQVHPYTLYG
ncbi:hypothetical protein D3C72_1831570 [compost metagenome]